MEYIIFVALSLLSVMVLLVTGGRSGVIDTGKKIKLYKEANGITPYKNSALALIIIVCFALALVLQISLYKNASQIDFVKLFVTFVIVFCAAVIDLKRRIIPNYLVIAGLTARVVIYIYEIASHQEIKKILVSDLIGLAIGFGFLALISFVTKGMLGFGDAKLFAVIGLMSGSLCTYSTLLLSLVVSLVVSLVGLLLKKIKKKDSFPFGPCIAVGYAAAVLLVSY